MVKRIKIASVSVTDNYRFQGSRFGMPSTTRKEDVSGTEALEFAMETIGKKVSQLGVTLEDMDFDYKLREKEGVSCLTLSTQAVAKDHSVHEYRARIKQKQ